jgi:hypothetical protein
MRFLAFKMAQIAVPILFLCMSSNSQVVQLRPVDPGLIAHEWGTFTSVAGSDGQAVEWQPLDWNTDLPGFVEHLHIAAFKQGLRGTVRMETPVLYFYSSHNVTLSVHVGFSRGIITEWYPHASTPIHNGSEDDIVLYRKHAAGGKITWDAVNVQPGWSGEFPQEVTPRSKFGTDNPVADVVNRYYAARQTLSNPLSVSTDGGEQYEKFLFYRGVSFVPVPLSAEFRDGGNLQVKKMQEEIPSMILFERRGDRIGYRVYKPLPGDKAATLRPLQLTARIESLYSDLEETLVAMGLYHDEAHAMIETWRNSWFEEGSRLFYIVPQAFVDRVLPLTITPAPVQTVRVFVGRVELISPATQKAVAAALANRDQSMLEKYGHFLEPIIAVLAQKKMLPKESCDMCPSQ